MSGVARQDGRTESAGPEDPDVPVAGASAYDGYDRSAIDRSGQAEAFDAIAGRYTEAFPHREGQQAATDWLTDNLPAGSRVLDVGCGTGLPTAGRLAGAGHRVVGVDLSAAMVALARENVPGAEFHQLDLADIGPGGAAPLGRFDAVAAFFSLLMLPRAEIPPALRMLHQLMRPEGLLALSMVEADVDDTVIPFLGNSIRVSGYLRDELRQVVREAGFEIAGENSYAYAPASTEVPPEIQLFLHCRRRA
ncbi:MULTISPECIES: class I SAM-dependent methyltransferase [Streptomyces]|uniref:Class I SAM-dependent methyltransferase n=1 Tax=Streptomyces lycii TaxID=2654337 RepID=A0ABQ7FLQ7_9ACTN|nr:MULTISPECIES: class I SAM-dependent methyltransferase [Streptomyces]KAF4409869.1 class I SAM-dependent methyltransferase [Streptomyces lycii]PGH48466.1 SAM-dependent methyltransferase [Streptomyces sp. Ru87]